MRLRPVSTLKDLAQTHGLAVTCRCLSFAPLYRTFARGALDFPPVGVKLLRDFISGLIEMCSHFLLVEHSFEPVYHIVSNVVIREIIKHNNATVYCLTRKTTSDMSSDLELCFRLPELSGRIFL